MSNIPGSEQFEHNVQAVTILSRALAEASNPPEELTVSEWADRYRYVSEDSGSPWPGLFKTSRVPYIREPQDCLHPDHPMRRGTARWAAQLGKSTILENWSGYTVDQAPGSMMLCLPTLEEAIKFNRIKLQPTIEASPRLRHKVARTNTRDEQGSTTTFKKFAGGFLQVINAGSSKGLQMVSIKNLGMDEITGYPRDVDGRGSPRDQARARQKFYGDLAKEFQCSTPGIAGECEITEDFEKGDRRYLYISCVHCNTYSPLRFSNMVGRDGDTPTHFVCPSCQGKITNNHKPEFMPDAEWIATIPMEDGSEVPPFFPASDLSKYKCEPCEGRCRNHQPSWHLWAAYAPKETFDAIWDRWTVAQGNTTKLRVFYQQDLAEPYETTAQTVDWEKIVDAARLEDIPTGTIPVNAGLLISTADVQGYGIKWAVYAFGPEDQCWIIDREIFEGDPSKSDEPWIALADALERSYSTASGIEKKLDLTGIDSGYATQRVYRFCASRPSVIPVDGRQDQKPGWVGTPTAQKIKDERGRVIAKVSLYPIYLYDVKCSVMGAIANLVDGPSETGQWPRNTLHIAHDICDADFSKELTAESLIDASEEARSAVNRRARNLVSPKSKREWKRIAGRANDWWDTAVYAFALCWYLRTRRKITNERWQILLNELHGAKPEDDLFERAENSPFVSKKKASGDKPKMADYSAMLNSKK